jgi:hypothetical protein
VRIVTRRKRKRSISTIVRGEIVKTERSAIDRERSIPTRGGLILRRIVTREAEARITIRRIRTVNIKKRKNVEIVLKKGRRIIVARGREKKEVIIDLFIIKTLHSFLIPVI